MVGEGVTLVVNMCLEYPGPTREYEKHGIEQLRLPFVDTESVSASGLIKGAAKIKQHLSDRPDGKIFIHCKGGIARASTMTLAHYVLNERDTDVDGRVRWMKAKRGVVFEGVKGFGVVKELVEGVKTEKM